MRASSGFNQGSNSPTESTHHTKQIYVFDSTFISPLALALFGGSFKMEWETEMDK